MAPLNSIRVSFYYSDEAVFTKAKQFRTLPRVVAWADQFYKRYGFKIDAHPLPYNESVYKKTFCLKKSNGLKADYTRAVYYKMFSEALDKETTALNAELYDLADDPPWNPVEKEARKDALIARFVNHSKNQDRVIKFLLEINPGEVEFRRQIHQKVEETRLRPKRERLVVIFCEFINLLSIFRDNMVIAETFAQDDRRASFMAWNLISVLFPDQAVFTGPLIWIDVNEVTPCAEWVLAHEIVHAAGNTTQDNQGSSGNIMIYKDVLCKAPQHVKLEPSDLAKLKSAFFVL